MAKDIFNNHKNIVKQMMKLDGLVNNMLPRSELSLTATEQSTLGFFTILRGIYRAIIALLIKNLATESEILVRSLITVSLRLMYLDKHPGDRIALILGESNKFYDQWYYISKEASKIGLEPNLDLIESKIKESKKKVRIYADQCKIKKYETFPDEKNMACDVGKEQAYLNYKITSQAVHISPFSYTKKRKVINNVHHLMNITVDISDIHAVAIEAMEWFLEGSISIGKIFGWDNIGQLELLGHDGEAILENIKKI
ncbi:MAG: DUF5677 domain-containing protein [Thermodesulfobacteriota bacterium]